MTSDSNLVSAVIPTLNRPELVVRAVESALAQSFDSVEVVVVIDGPDRPTHQALQAIGDPRLRVTQLPHNIGGASARNVGVQLARGHWVAFLDDDDEWLPNKLEKQMPIATRSSSAYPIVSSAVIARTPCADFVWPRKRPRVPLSEYLFARTSWTQGEALLQTSTLLTKRELLLRVPFAEGLRKHQDWDWLLRATARTDVGVEFLHEPLAIWNIEEKRRTISTNGDWKYSLQWIRQNRSLVTKRAYAGFFATELSSQASREGSWSVFFPLLWEAIRDGQPAARDIVLYLLIWLVPQNLRRWSRSVHSGLPRQLMSPK